MSRLLLPLALGALALATEVHAQAESVDLAPGRRIRVTTVGSNLAIGNLVSLGPDTLVLVRDEGDTVRVLRGAVTRLDLYQGMRSNVGRGAVKGTIIGAGIGLVLGVMAAATQDESEWFYTPPGQLILGGTLGGAIWGVAIGSLVGALSKSPRWERIPMPTVQVQPGGQGTGVVVGLNFRF